MNVSLLLLLLLLLAELACMEYSSSRLRDSEPQRHRVSYINVSSRVILCRFRALELRTASTGGMWGL